MDEQEIWRIANKRARYALAQIANNQMNTWRNTKSADEPVDIIARQIAEGMNDTLSSSSEPKANGSPDSLPSNME